MEVGKERTLENISPWATGMRMEIGIESKQSLSFLSSLSLFWGEGRRSESFFLFFYVSFRLEFSGHFLEAPVSFYNVQRYGLGRWVLDLVVVVFLAGRNDWNWVRF